MIRLFEQKPERFLRYLLLAQLVMWTAVPILTYANAPTDVLQNIGWGREWRLGYPKAPPASAWLTYGAFLAGGGRLWLIYLLSQACVVLTQLGNYALVRDVAGPKRALWAVVLFSLVYYASFPTPEFNANVLQMPIWIWSAFVLRRAIIRRTALWWLALGLLLAASLYAKYSVAILIGSLAIATLSQRSGRSSLILPWPWLALGLAVALSLPQLLWLKSVDFLPLAYTADGGSPGLANRFSQVGDFLGGELLAQVLAAGLLVVVGARLIRTPIEAPGPFDERRFVLVMALAPLVLAAVTALANPFGLRDMGAAPMAAYLTVAAAVLFDTDVSPLRTKVALWVWLALFITLPTSAGLAARYAAFAAKPGGVAFPGPSVAQSLDRIWEDQTASPLDIVAGPTWDAGMIAAYSHDRPSVFVDGSWRYNPWIRRERVANRGILVVWTGSEQPPTPLAALGPFQARGHVLARYKTAGKFATVNWAIRAPGLPAPVGAP